MWIRLLWNSSLMWTSCSHPWPKAADCARSEGPVFLLTFPPFHLHIERIRRTTDCTEGRNKFAGYLAPTRYPFPTQVTQMKRLAGEGMESSGKEKRWMGAINASVLSSSLRHPQNWFPCAFPFLPPARSFRLIFDVFEPSFTKRCFSCSKRPRTFRSICSHPLRGARPALKPEARSMGEMNRGVR